MLRISSHFDSGAIEIININDASGEINLNIRSDNQSEFAQWFHFRLQGARGQACTLRLLNAARSAYPDGWPGYQAAASYDREHWFRVPTTYTNGILSIAHAPEQDSIYYAYFEPYSWERHLDLLGRVARSPLVRIEDLGQTVDGRDLNLVRVSQDDQQNSPRKKVWVIARQHPGETMAEWFVEGMLNRLLDNSDPVSRRLLDFADFYVVPNMNPDGSVRGNLRTNAVGVNLNREWMQPTRETSPEVYYVRQRLLETGADLFIDAHGDEALPYNFVSGCEMLPDFSPRQAAEQTAFISSFKAASPDFQDVYGYAASRYSTDALKLASKWVGHQFGCLSLTLEMPFKDNADMPDARVGWNGPRSKKLGEAILVPVLANVTASLMHRPG